MPAPRIIFFGTSSFAVPSLTALKSAGYPIASVITTPPKPAGRKKILSPSPIKLTAEKYGLETSEPASLKAIALPPADLFIIASYGKFLPDSILTLPAHGTLNIHPSLLPKYRGPSPIQSALLAGEKETGVTIMLTDKEMDHGPIISQKKVAIASDDTAETLMIRLADEGAALLLATIPDWISGHIRAKEQDHESATSTSIIKKENGHIDWSRPSEKILNQMRAYTPWPGSWSEIEIHKKPLRIKILKAHAGENISFKTPPGSIRPNTQTLEIACADHWLLIDQLQPEGKNTMTSSEFLRGYR
jgi:methionyl-tRNA formyltransferase